MAYCKVIWLWIQILWPWPQLHKCQCSRFAFTEQTATAKLILTWLLPLQRHGQKQRCACAFAMPAHSAAVGSPSSPLVAAEGTGENWCLYPSHPSRLFSAGWISSCQPPANLFVTSSWLPQLWEPVAAKAAEVCLPATLFYTWFCVTVFTEELFGQNRHKNEQNQDCLYQAGFRNSRFSCNLCIALQLVLLENMY